MKFKQYKLIIESDKKEDKDPHPLFKDMSHYRKKIDSEDEIVKLIREKCDISNYLYRGFEDDGDYYIIDGSKGKRVSKNTTNYYTVILDHIFKNEPQYKGFPLRSESIICSTSKKTASNYGNVYVILPFKGVDIGYIGSDDIWRSYVNIGDYETRIHAWNDIFAAIGIDNGSDYNTMINNLLRDHTDALNSMHEGAQDEYHDHHNEDDDYDEDYEVTNRDIESYIDMWVDEYNLDDIDDVFEGTSGGYKGTEKDVILIKMFGYKELSRAEMEKVINESYDPEDLGFELINTENLKNSTNNEDVECWFGDKCVAVSIDKWDEIKKKV